MPISLTKCTVLWTALKPCFPYYSNTKSLNCLQDFKGTQSADAHAHSCALIVSFPRTNFMKNSFSYSGAVLWNSLPCDMREAKSLSQFKRLAHLNSWFFKSTMYSCILFRVVRFILKKILFSWWILPCLNKELFYSILSKMLQRNFTHSNDTA